jgi:hypothetical protein
MCDEKTPGSQGWRSRVSRRREWERPPPSVVWQTIAVLFLGFAFAAALSALTVARDTAVGPAKLWIGAAAFIGLAVTCFLAHWDVNRGRRAKCYETEELVRSEDA